MFDTFCILNLQLRLWDSYISKTMSGLHCVEEDSELDAVAHLALARRQNQRTAFWGNANDKNSRLAAVF